jgi:hypothetical protein
LAGERLAPVGILKDPRGRRSAVVPAQIFTSLRKVGNFRKLDLARDVATGFILLVVAISDAPFLRHRLIALKAYVLFLALSQQQPHGLDGNHQQRHGDNGHSNRARDHKQKLQAGWYPHPLDNPAIA